MVWVWAGVRKPPMHEPAGSGGVAMGIYQRRGGEGSRMMAGLPLAFDAEGRGRVARAPVGRCPGVRQADVVLISMAAELAVGLDMQSPDSRSGTASTRDCGSPRRVTTPSSRWTQVRRVERVAGQRFG